MVDRFYLVRRYSERRVYIVAFSCELSADGCFLFTAIGVIDVRFFNRSDNTVMSLIFI